VKVAVEQQLHVLGCCASMDSDVKHPVLGCSAFVDFALERLPLLGCCAVVGWAAEQQIPVVGCFPLLDWALEWHPQLAALPVPPLGGCPGWSLILSAAACTVTI